MRLLVQVDGVAELNRKLAIIERRLLTKWSRRAVTEASAPLLAEVRAVTPIGPTKNLRRSLKRVVRRVPKFGNAMTASIRFYGAPHAHLVRKGTRGRRVAKQARILSNANRGYAKKGYLNGRYFKLRGAPGTAFGRSVAPMPANPFFDRAWSQHVSRIPLSMAEALTREFQQAGLAI